jgi:polysaccharide chain length determinant protein (PEP-CTERM system associated)
MQDQIRLFLTEFRSAWRYRWKALAAVWLVALAGWFVVLKIPSQYESSAKIHVDANSLLGPLLEGITVDNGLDNQVDLVRNMLLSREHIESVIDSTPLKLRAKTQTERERLSRELGKDIRIDATASSSRSRGANIFVISYRDRDPALAFAVVKSLVDEFVSQSVGANRVDADVAQGFLRSQISEYEKRLTASEQRLADFKKQNVGAMPDERGGYFTRLQAETAQLDQLRAQLTIAIHSRDDIRQRLIGGSESTPAAPTSIETSVDARLQTERNKLEELLVRFTDQHPEVIGVKETIARLEEQRRQEIAALRSNVLSAGAPTGTTSLVRQNLQIALNEAENRVSSLRAQAEGSEQRVADLRRQMNVLPAVEAELAKLNRDYDVTKAEYERLLQRLESAKLTDAADRVDETRVRIVDQPVRSNVPVAPKRALMLLAVCAMALCAGAALAWGLSQLHPVYISAEQLESETGLRVVGTVSTVSDSPNRMWPGAVPLALLLMVYFSATLVLVRFSAAVGALMHLPIPR